MVTPRTGVTKTGKIKVGLVCIATGAYNQFVNQLCESVEQYFFKDQLVHIILLSDEEHKDAPLVRIPWKHRPWPGPTLYRYMGIIAARMYTQSLDYCFYCDIDMRFVDYVNDEILPADDRHLVAVRHPGFWKGGGSWETRPESQAYVPPDRRKTYYAGGFQGGSAGKYQYAAREMHAMVMADIHNSVVPVWHDESIWNNLLSRKTVHELSPSYCSPEGDEPWKVQCRTAFPPKILALNKDHATLRTYNEDK